MESVLGRYKNLIWLVGVLFLQVLGLATQVKRGNDPEHTRLIRVWVISAITPFERGVLWIEHGTGDLWHNYIYLRGVRAENRQLKDQIEQMRLEQVRLSEDAAQARRLQNLLAFKEQFIAKTVAAQVIGTSGTPTNRVIYIDKGKDDGISKDDAVITADGIVGKVSLVNSSDAQVLMISDQMSGVGVIIGDDRLQGWLGGTSNGEVVLNDVMSDETVPIGARVMTSGGDRIFPRGLPVGTVAKVTNGKDLFLNIKIKPAADLSRLEEVLVVVEKQQRQAVAEGDVRMRAADILAQRLPSVPAKPAAAGGAAPEASAKSTPNGAAVTAALKPASASSSGTTPKTGSGTTDRSGAAAEAGASPAAAGPIKPANATNGTASTASPSTTKTSAAQREKTSSDGASRDGMSSDAAVPSAPAGTNAPTVSPKPASPKPKSAQPPAQLPASPTANDANPH